MSRLDDDGEGKRGRLNYDHRECNGSRPKLTLSTLVRDRDTGFGGEALARFLCSMIIGTLESLWRYTIIP